MRALVENLGRCRLRSAVSGRDAARCGGLARIAGARAAAVRRPLALGLVLAAAAFALDQASKHWMIAVFDIASRQPIRLAPFLDVVMAWNPGVSYSLLPFMGRYGLLAVAGLAVAVLGVWLWRTPDRLTGAALGLIIGGALGNALDRFRFGAVADFFFLHTDLPVGPLANYVFNVADVAIVAGVALLLYESAFPASPAPPNGRDGAVSAG
ncbi:MAG: signal peptidase II [Hyphomicrobiales bacterium]|nr:signal peptidase II [Hyphomicrobiales bacterium]